MRFSTWYHSQWANRKLANGEAEMKERENDPGAGETGSLLIKAALALVALAVLYFVSR